MSAHILLMTLALQLPPQPGHAVTPVGAELHEPGSVITVAVRPVSGSLMPAPGLPREPWLQTDPADSLYKAAREAMSRGSSERAARLFQEIVAEHPESAYAADAPYWQAFNLYRLATADPAMESVDSRALLRRALAALEAQQDHYPDAPTRKNGEAGTLATRILGFQGRFQPALAARALNQARARLSEVRTIQASEVSGSVVVAYSEQDDAKLKEQCDDPDIEIRSAALSAAVNANRQGAVLLLGQVLERSGGPCQTILRRKVPYLLTQTRTAEGREMLLELARNDPDSNVQLSAMWQISRMDDERVVPLLGRLTESDDEVVVERAISALGNRRDDASNRILWAVAEDRNRDPELRTKALYSLSRRGEQNLERLRSLFGNAADPEVRKHLVGDVARAGGAGAVDWLLSVATAADADEEIRSSAIYHLGRIEETPVANLADLYGQVIGEELRKSVLGALARRDEPEALDKLIAVARTEEDQELRKSAIYWLGRSDDPRALEVLMEIVNR